MFRLSSLRSAFLVTAVLLITPGCEDLLGPTNTELTVIIGSSCRGNLNGAVTIYIDNDYKGQTTGRLLIEVESGRRLFEAFTDGRRLRWGPDQIEVPPGGLRYTLDC